MSTEQIIEWIKDALVLLESKRVRDRAYLDRRAARRICTPTDVLLEQDQFLLAELQVFLQEALEATQGDDES
jgi:hypothetical protein